MIKSVGIDDYVMLFSMVSIARRPIRECMTLTYI